MTSPDVVVPALLLPIPLLSLLLSLYSSLFRRSTPLKHALSLLLAILAAVAGGSALSVACGSPLRIVAKLFTVLLHITLSGISIFALSPSSQAFPCAPPFLPFCLSVSALLLACELVSALIPTSPLLLPAILALSSRSTVLALAVTSVLILRRRRAAVAFKFCVEKGPTTDDASGKTPGRVSSPTLATWPFPGSLALQRTSNSAPLDPLSPSVTNACQTDTQNPVLLPLVLVTTQTFATLTAALSVAACMLVDAATDRHLPHILVADAVCTLLWSFMALVIIYILPANTPPPSSGNRDAIGCKQGPLRTDPGSDSTVPWTPKPSLSRRESDSILDFLSLRDPFASLPPPPPLPPVGLGLDDVDVGWSGNKEIGIQYRFPAPRSIIKGGRRKGKNHHAAGKKRLAHQDSSRTLLPVPETRGTEADGEKDKGFGDEARLAQLLLESLNEIGKDSESQDTSTPVPTVQSPQAVYVQPSSRWSTSTAIQSVVSASISNKSGVSTYTTCASERVPPSRVSMNTIASVLGSRKSSEARRKSATTASSSKG